MAYEPLRVIWHKPYNAGKKSPSGMKRLARMKNDYAIEIYYKGSYPKKHGGQIIGDVATILQSGIQVKPKLTGRRGRPVSVKKWEWEKQVSKSHSKRDWRRDINSIGKRVIDGTLYNIKSGYSQLGKKIVSQIQDKIMATIAPPLEPSTIRRKKSSKPLIETKKLYKSVKYRVVPGSSVKRSSSYGGLGGLGVFAVPNWIPAEELANMTYADLVQALNQQEAMNMAQAEDYFNENGGSE